MSNEVKVYKREGDVVSAGEKFISDHKAYETKQFNGFDRTSDTEVDIDPCVHCVASGNKRLCESLPHCLTDKTHLYFIEINKKD